MEQQVTTRCAGTNGAAFYVSNPRARQGSVSSCGRRPGSTALPARIFGDVGRSSRERGSVNEGRIDNGHLRARHACCCRADQGLCSAPRTAYSTPSWPRYPEDAPVRSGLAGRVERSAEYVHCCAAHHGIAWVPVSHSVSLRRQVRPGSAGPTPHHRSGATQPEGRTAQSTNA